MDEFIKLKFKATRLKRKHRGRELYFRDGTILPVDIKRAKILLRDFPDNFTVVADTPFRQVKPLITSPQPRPKPLPELKSTPIVSILIPQRGRPNYIKKCLELILQNTTYPGYEVILICDRDDMDSIATIPQDEKIIVIIDPSPKRQMYVGKINFAFRISKADYIVYLANDVNVHKNWLTEAMKSMQTLPDTMGLVAFNHGNNFPQAYHGLVSRRFCNKFLGGNVFYPEYIHFWCDLEITQIAKIAKRFSLSLAGRVSHSSPEDALHQEGWNKSFTQGRDLLIRRRNMGFPYTVKMSEITMVTIQHQPNIIQKDLLSYLPKEIEFIKLDNEDNKNFDSAAKAFNYGIKKARNDLVVCVHEDMVFEESWFDAFIEQEDKLENWGVLGIVGMVSGKPHHYWGYKHDKPCEAETLDECCIILNKKNNIWFDEKTFTAWHSYGVDFCLQARHKGLKLYIIGGKAHHNDTWKHYTKLILPQEARNLIRQKWGKIFGTIRTTTGAC